MSLGAPRGNKGRRGMGVDAKIGKSEKRRPEGAQGKKRTDPFLEGRNTRVGLAKSEE